MEHHQGALNLNNKQATDPLLSVACLCNPAI